MWQAIHDHAHKAGVNHELVLFENPLECLVEVVLQPTLQLSPLPLGLALQPGLHERLHVCVFITEEMKKQ